MSSEDTIVALSTPRGESAVALIRVSGPACKTLARAAFGRDLQARRASLATYKNLDGVALDQVLAIVFEGPASYTGEPMLEIAPHGSPYIIGRILEDLLARGCRHAQPGEFTRRAFMAGKMDLTQAEAVADVIAARSERALRAAQKRLSGELGRRLEGYRVSLLETLAQLEAYIDFPEEDIPPETTEGPTAALSQLAQALSALAQTGRSNDLLRSGVKTIIVGAPNAGKSSLLNALLGEDRALVSPEAGTTRDVIAEPMQLGAHTVQIMDTAGLRLGETALERAGIAKTLEKMRGADFLLLVLDATAPCPALPEESLPLFHVEQSLVILNKCDLPGAHDHTDILAGCPRARVSAKTGQGLAEMKALWQTTLEKSLALPDPEALLVSSRHALALSEAALALSRARELLLNQKPTELACAEIRLALETFGEIVGRFDNEHMLDALFGKFCIGK